MDPADRKQKIRLFIFASAALLAAAGIFLRCQGLDRFLEYDEIWTFRFYAPLPWHEIFTDLAMPNNHCLNSLLIKWLCSLFPSSAVLLRIPALAAGILTVVLILWAVWKMVRRPGAIIMATFWIAFQADLIHYSRTARGYSPQCFFVLAFFLLLIRPALTAGFRADEQDRAGLYLCEKPLLTAPEYLALEEQTGDRIRFYRFRKTSATGGSKP